MPKLKSAPSVNGRERGASERAGKGGSQAEVLVNIKIKIKWV